MCDGRELLPEQKCIISQEINIKENTTFSFWYFMYGSQIGTLHFFKDEEVIWTRIGRQKKEWLKAEVGLPIGIYNVIINGIFL